MSDPPLDAAGIRFSNPFFPERLAAGREATLNGPAIFCERRVSRYFV
jgi:hypothetical protein